MKLMHVQSLKEFLEKFGHLPLEDQARLFGLPPIMGGESKSGETDSDEEDDDDDSEDDDEDDDEEDGEDDNSGKSKGRKAGATKPNMVKMTQEELDRLVNRRVDRAKRSSRADIEKEIRESLAAEAEIARRKKAGDYEPVIKAKDDEIKKLKDVEPELTAYRDYFSDLLDQEIKDLPKNVVDKLMPKNLSPLDQLDWIKEYRASTGTTSKKRKGDEEEDDEEGEDEEDKDETSSRRKSDDRSSTSRQGNRKRPNAKNEKIPTAEELRERALKKGRVPSRF